MSDLCQFSDACGKPASRVLIPVSDGGKSHEPFAVCARHAAVLEGVGEETVGFASSVAVLSDSQKVVEKARRKLIGEARRGRAFDAPGIASAFDKAACDLIKERLQIDRQFDALMGAFGKARRLAMDESTSAGQLAEAVSRAADLEYEVLGDCEIGGTLLTEVCKSFDLSEEDFESWPDDVERDPKGRFKADCKKVAKTPQPV